jgi:hypothetical protein
MHSTDLTRHDQRESKETTNPDIGYYLEMMEEGSILLIS